MGVVDKFLDFGKNRRGKVIIWSVVSVGILLFLIGVILASVSPSSISPKSIKLVAADMQSSKSGAITNYYLDVSSKQTSVTVLPDPINANTPAVFRSRSGYLSVTSKVPAGGTAIIELKQINGEYGFSDPNNPSDAYHIDVTCGRQSVRIYVRIVLRPEAVNVTATLEKNTDFDGVAWALWNPAESVKMEYLHRNSPMPPRYEGAAYRVRLKLWLFNEEIYDTGLRNGRDYQHFDYIDLDNTGIKLFERSNNNQNNHIITEDVDFPDEETLYFKIFCEFQISQDSTIKVFTKSDFRLTIEGWTEL